jgi:hypothetical protein
MQSYLARLQSVSAHCRNLAEIFSRVQFFFLFSKFYSTLFFVFFDSHTAPLAINPGRSWTKLVRQICKVGCKRFLLHISPYSLRWRSKRGKKCNVRSQDTFSVDRVVVFCPCVTCHPSYTIYPGYLLQLCVVFNAKFTRCGFHLRQMRCRNWLKKFFD